MKTPSWNCFATGRHLLQLTDGNAIFCLSSDVIHPGTNLKKKSYSLNFSKNTKSIQKA